MAIPVVDLSRFTEGTASQKADFVQQLGRAFEEVGFVSVMNHGIPDQLIADQYRLVQEFFGLPDEKKRQYEIPGLAGQRGYTSFGKEHAKGSDAPDLKEFFQYGQTVTDADVISEEYPANVMVDAIPQLNDTLYQAYRHFEKKWGCIAGSYCIVSGATRKLF